MAQAPRPPRSTWTAAGPTIHDAPTPLIPGAFPVDQMDAACARVLASGKIVGTREASILGANGCGIAYPISLHAVVLGGGDQVEFKPAPILRCDLADRLADWVRDDLIPLGAERGRLTAVADATAYMCRGRNNVLGAPMSEHGRGDAIDILALRFAKQDVLLRQGDAHDLWSKVKVATCTRFMTVLGPGSDGYHENNLHLDLESRRNGSHYCHWDNP